MYTDRIFSLGGSVSSSLTIRFPRDAKALIMEEINGYKGYVVFDNECEIPEHFKKCISGIHWCRIYDDEECRLYIRGENIEIYRGGKREILIHAYGKTGHWVEGRKIK